jgi:hypothetical protein
MLVEAAAREDADRSEPGFVEDGAHRPRMGGVIAAVDPDGADRDPLGRETRRKRRDDRGAALGVIGVDQQGKLPRPDASEVRESGLLVVVRLHERMGHRAHDRDTEVTACLDRRRAGKSRDVSRARGEQPGLGAVRAAQPEIDEPAARRGEHHPRPLGCDDRLKMQQVQEPRLDQLGLGQRRGDAEDGLVGKEDGPLRHRIDVSRPSEIGKTVKESGRELAGPAEPGERFAVETQRFKVVERLLKARRHQEAALARKLADEQLEHCRFGHAVRRIGLQHRKLVEVREQGILVSHHPTMGRGRRSLLDLAQWRPWGFRGASQTGRPAIPAPQPGPDRPPPNR